MEELKSYDYVLPESAIAQTPLQDRSASRLLHLEPATGEVHHRQFLDVLDLLNAGDLLVMNETRVTALRLFGNKATGGRFELLLLKDLGGGRYESLARPAKRLPIGSELGFESGIRCVVMDDMGEGRKVVQFNPEPDLHSKIEADGFAPLPPYIHVELKEKERYQTVYATAGGSAAAPTAGLHFTLEILESLRAKGVGTATVNLNVGLDTFRPLSTENLDEHKMHGETCSVPEETARKVAECKGRVIAVGTTTVRTLETFAKGPRMLNTGERISTLFIRPGFKFQVIDGMFTNFHMPRTTMLVMLSAFAGRDLIAKGYEAALKNGYRFLSFGDSMLLL